MFEDTAVTYINFQKTYQNLNKSDHFMVYLDTSIFNIIGSYFDLIYFFMCCIDLK